MIFSVFYFLFILYVDKAYILFYLCHKHVFGRVDYKLYVLLLNRLFVGSCFWLTLINIWWVDMGRDLILRYLHNSYDFKMFQCCPIDWQHTQLGNVVWLFRTIQLLVLWRKRSHTGISLKQLTWNEWNFLQIKHKFFLSVRLS